MRKKDFDINEYTIRLEDHAKIRCRERSIPPEEVKQVIRQWDVIEECDDGEVLLWGQIDNYRIIHVPCREPNHILKIIWAKTTYYPDDESSFSSESNYREKVKKK
jgi:hypothetical protein